MTRSTFAVFTAVLIVLVASGGAAAGPQPAVAQTDETVDCTYPVTVTDATGQAVTVEDEPESVVALAPSAAQVLWAVGAREKVVGMPVGYTTAYLNGSANRTNVLNQELQPVIETVVDLEPDLVLAPNVISEDTVGTLREKGLTVVRLEKADSIDDVTAKTRLIGRLVGSYDRAAKVSARTEATVNAIANATGGESNPTVYYAMGGGYTAGPDTFIGDVLAAAGAENVAAAANVSGYGVISEEVVATEDPDWIVTTGPGLLRKSAAINSTTAVKQDQIVRVNGNFISQPGPYVTRPLTTLAGTFHPETAGSLSIDPGSVSVPSCAAVSDGTTGTSGGTTAADGGPTTDATTASDGSLTVTITDDANVTGPDSATTETTSQGNAPGFGTVAALVALAASALLARRR